MHKGSRHTDTYFIDIKKSLFVIKMIEYMYMYMYICKSVNLLKSHDNLLGIIYRIKIMLNGIAIIKQPKTPFISFFVQLHFIK